MEVVEDVLDDQLGAAVRIGGRTGEVLGDGHAGGIAVNRAGGAEHHRVHAVLLHHLAEHQRTGDVVLVVAQRDPHRLPDRLEPGEVDDRLHRLAGEYPVQACLIDQVDLVEVEGTAGQRLDPDQRFGVAVGEIVHHHDLLAGLEQLETGLAADEACAAGDQDGHEVPHSA